MNRLSLCLVNDREHLFISYIIINVICSFLHQNSIVILLTTTLLEVSYQSKYLLNWLFISTFSHFYYELTLYFRDKVKCLDDLYDCVYNILDTCKKKSFRRVAMSAISAGKMFVVIYVIW